MTTLPGYFPFGSLSPNAITIVPGDRSGIAGVVSGEVEVNSSKQPAHVTVAPSGRPTVPLEHLRRLIDDAYSSFQRASKDFRRVEGVAAPNQFGLTFSAMRVMFYKWVELAALSLESADQALNVATMHVLDHLYQRTAAGKLGGARQCRDILEQLEEMRGRVQEQQRFLSTLVAQTYQ